VLGLGTEHAVGLDVARARDPEPCFRQLLFDIGTLHGSTSRRLSTSKAAAGVSAGASTPSQDKKFSFGSLAFDVVETSDSSGERSRAVMARGALSNLRGGTGLTNPEKARFDVPICT
jgi:hypothetical protein